MFLICIIFWLFELNADPLIEIAIGENRMTKGIYIFLLVLVLLTSTAIICTAQPIPGGFPGTVPGVGPSYPGGQVPGVGPSYPSGQVPGVGPSYPGGQVPVDQSGNGHPATGPESAQPNEAQAPSASTGNVVMSLSDKQALNTQDITKNFGSAPQSNQNPSKTQYQYQQIIIPTGIQYWAFYNGMWTQGYSAVWFNQNMNLLLNNDQAQNIWAYELYPNGMPMWSNWGYRWAGSYNAIFNGDTHGWHLCAIWGDHSGWSNVLWVYVW